MNRFLRLRAYMRSHQRLRVSTLRRQKTSPSPTRTQNPSTTSFPSPSSVSVSAPPPIPSYDTCPPLTFPAPSPSPTLACQSQTCSTPSAAALPCPCPPKGSRSLSSHLLPKSQLKLSSATNSLTRHMPPLSPPPLPLHSSIAFKFLQPLTSHIHSSSPSAAAGLPSPPIPGIKAMSSQRAFRAPPMLRARGPSTEATIHTSSYSREERLAVSVSAQRRRISMLLCPTYPSGSGNGSVRAFPAIIAVPVPVPIPVLSTPSPSPSPLPSSPSSPPTLLPSSSTMTMSRHSRTGFRGFYASFGFGVGCFAEAEGAGAGAGAGAYQGVGCGAWDVGCGVWGVREIMTSMPTPRSSNLLRRFKLGGGGAVHLHKVKPNQTTFRRHTFYSGPPSGRQRLSPPTKAAAAIFHSKPPTEPPSPSSKSKSKSNFKSNSNVDDIAA